MRLRAGGLTPIERLRGERMCAYSGRIYADNIQEVRRQRKTVRKGGTAEADRLRTCGLGLIEAERDREERTSSYRQHLMSPQPAPTSDAHTERDR